MSNTETDALMAALFTLAAASGLGVANVEIASYQFTDVFLTLTGVEITTGSLIAVLALGVAWYLNNPAPRRWSREKQILVGLTIFGVFGGILVPDMLDSLSQNVVVALSVIGIESGGYWAIAQSG
jgi:hypothetical protein